MPLSVDGFVMEELYFIINSISYHIMSLIFYFMILRIIYYITCLLIMIMAVNINRPFMNNTGLNENNCFSNLIHHISPNIENEIDIINHSTYYNDDDFKDVLKNTKRELRILNLNCLNLNTRFDLLKLFLVDVDINSQIDCITLQGTCFNENTDLTFYNIPGYSLISNPCRLSTHCGVAIYLHEKFSYERKFVDIFSTVFENIYVET